MSRSGRDESTSFAARFLRQAPGIRDRVLASHEFTEWLKPSKSVVIDGNKFYIVGGDMLKDEDEMILNWARKQGLVDQETLDRFYQAEESN
jgi:hypothetical protein